MRDIQPNPAVLYAARENMAEGIVGLRKSMPYVPSLLLLLDDS